MSESSILSDAALAEWLRTTPPRQAVLSELERLDARRKLLKRVLRFSHACPQSAADDRRETREEARP